VPEEPAVPTQRTLSHDDIIEAAIDHIDLERASPAADAGVSLLAWLEGLVTAAAIGPERTLPDEWLHKLPSRLYGDREVIGESLLELLTLKHNHILEALKCDKADYEPSFLDDAEEDELMERACMFADGFRRGMNLRRGSWAALATDASVRTSRPAALALLTIGMFMDGITPDAPDQDVLRDQRAALLPDIGGAIWQLFRFWSERTRRTPARLNPLAGLGRNAFCPCGSGLKFKRCCMN
jgi:yecA family protein